MKTAIAIVLMFGFAQAQAFQYYLTNQWYNGGNHFCEYSNGTVLNVGIGLCPFTING